MAYTTQTTAIVAYRKNSGLTQSDVAHMMATTQSAVARLEKRLIQGEDVTLSTLERYASAVGVTIQWNLKPKVKKYGIFDSADDAIAFAIHSSACEGLVTPEEDIENLKKVAKGELSGKELIKLYIAEAVGKKDDLS